MTDENEIVEDTSERTEAQGPVCGERLAEARRELQISLLDIAKELHLDEFKVRALESNDFEVLGAPVFAKGHLKKYAQLVSVAEADVIADYYQLERAAAAPALVPGHTRPRPPVSLGPWIATIIVIAAAATAYWWFTTQEKPAEAPSEPRAEAPEPGANIAVEPGGPQATTDEDSALDVLPAEPVAEPVAETQVPTAQTGLRPEPQSTASSAVPSLSLSVSWTGDCWTEITDAAGRRLYFALGKAGETVDLQGEAPVSVLFGDADNASLLVNGEPYSLSARERRGQTARLVIDGS